MSRSVPSLQRRLLVGLACALGGLWLLTGLLLGLDARHELDELLDAHLTQSAALLVARQAPGHDNDEDDGLVDAPTLHRYSRQVFFQVWHEGQLILRSSNAPASPLMARADGFETRNIDGQRWRLFATRGIENDIQVYVGEQLEAREAILVAVMRGLLMPMLVALPLILLLIWWVIRRGLKPLHALQQQLAGRAPLALTPLPLTPGTPSEIAPLQATLNGLFERIAQLLDSERRFTADAAHELRTPIAAIRAQAQVALGAQDEPDRRHALQATLAGCDRASHLVQQLLTLARLEAGATQPLQTPDLAALTRRVAAELAPAALARGQQLEVLADTPVICSADEALLGVLLRNLIDNALRYAPDGAQVVVSAGLVGDGLVGSGRWRWCIDDSGPGLAEADMARLGERFFRVLGTAASGSGLGWSIVRRIAAVTGCSIQLARSTTLGGLRVEVSGPVA